MFDWSLSEKDYEDIDQILKTTVTDPIGPSLCIPLIVVTKTIRESSHSKGSRYSAFTIALHKLANALFYTKKQVIIGFKPI